MPDPKTFLDSRSMLTPGIAGATVMLIANALGDQFNAPRSVTALVLSFVLGTVSFVDTRAKLPERLVLFVLNSLIVFSIAVGTQEAGRHVATAANPSAMTGTGLAHQGGFWADWFGQR